MRRCARFVLFLGVVTAALLALSACSFNLAGDITPPPGWQPTPVPPTPDTASLYPALPPDPAKGKAIYEATCLPCHGERGQGNGPVALDRGLNPAAFADAEEVREASPAAWFVTVSRGRPEKGMPPFEDKLSVRQRWDVLAYIYTLGTPPQTLARGKEIFTQRCVTCHQSDGRGKGLVNQKRMAQSSDEELFRAVAGPQHESRVYEGLSDADRWAVVAYIRSLSFAHSPQTSATATSTTGETAAVTPTPATTPTAEATPGAQTITITGQVVNGTAGASVPPDLEVTLHGYDNPHGGEEAYTAKATIDAGGRFAFKDVPLKTGRMFFVTTEYRGVLYGSRSVSPPPGHPAIDLPVNIYETTTDLSEVAVERLHILLDTPSPGVLQVVEIYVITNNGDRTVVAPEKDAPVLTFHLPQGAVHLQFQNGDLGGRYVETADGFGDKLPIYPKLTTQEVFAYNLPMQGKKMVLNHPVPLPVAGAVLMVREGELTLSGDQLQDVGVSSAQGAEEYHVYNVGALPKDGVLRFTVSRPTSWFGQGSRSKTGLAIGLMALGVALIAVAVVLRREKPRVSSVDNAPMPAVAEDAAVWAERFANDADTLMDAILALDDLYAANKLDEAVYRARRAALKARLQAVMEGQGVAGGE